MRSILLLIFSLVLALNAYCQVRVRGYTRRDGTYVRPHMRSSPDGNPYNNYSYPGNTNPYTGKVATGNPETYLNNYGSGSSGTRYYSEAVRSEERHLRELYTPRPAPDPYKSMRAGETVTIIDQSPLRKAPNANAKPERYVGGNFKFVRDTGSYVQVDGPEGGGYISKSFLKETVIHEQDGAEVSPEPFVVKSYAKYADSVNRVVRVCLYSPVLSTPSFKGKVTANADNSKAVLLGEYNEVYCIVQIGRVKGYMNKKYLYYY